jgi:hypothetical protein
MPATATGRQAKPNQSGQPKDMAAPEDMAAPDAIRLGRYIGAAEDGLPLRVLCDAPELEAHVHRPWFHAYAAERLDFPLRRQEDAPCGSALVTPDLLSRHALLCGATGSGKTRLALHLLAEQLRAGCSVVMLDPKAETLRHLLHLAHSVGVTPERVTVLSPFLAGAGTPGWNPLDCSPKDGRATGLSPSQAAQDLASVLEQSSGSWGPRMQDLLVNALTVVSAYGLSLFELARLLQRDDYRAGLLALEPPPEHLRGDALAYGEARDFFLREFASWGRAEKAAAIAPVLNKFRELLRNPFLRPLLCARRSTLDVAGLWQRPGLVLVHLDGATLGDEGARLLGGMLAHQLLRTAMRASGPVPVVLALDEAGVSQQFLGGALSGILAVARSRNLRLLCCCQHLAQLSGELRTALLANAAVQAFFRLGPEDARAAASSFASGTGERVTSLLADAAKRDGEGRVEAWAEVSHTLRDGWGEPVRLSAPAWTAFRDLSGTMTGAEQIGAILRLAHVSGAGRLYVHAAGSGDPIGVGRYLSGLGPDEYEVRGPTPLRLVISFPRPRLSVVSRVTEGERERSWVRTLTGLGVRRAALRLSGGRPVVMEAVSVADPSSGGGAEQLLSGSVALSGQSAREVEAVARWRQEEVERIATGKAGMVEAETVGTGTSATETIPAGSGRETPKPRIKREPPPVAAKASSARPAAPEPRAGQIPSLVRPALDRPVSTAGDVGEDGSLV